MGGGTTRVGDPSGKDESRQMLTLEQIEANKDSLKQIFARLLALRRRRRPTPSWSTMPNG